MADEVSSTERERGHDMCLSGVYGTFLNGLRAFMLTEPQS